MLIEKENCFPNFFCYYFNIFPEIVMENETFYKEIYFQQILTKF